jgi:hypothetical protein
VTSPGLLDIVTAMACILAAQALACCAVVGGAVYGVLSGLAVAAGYVLLSGD